MKFRCGLFHNEQVFPKIYIRIVFAKHSFGTVLPGFRHPKSPKDLLFLELRENGGW